MINLANLERQHRSIAEEISIIEEEVKMVDSLNVTEIALHINKLAGQLKIHLLEEDRFLYPDLLNNTDMEVQTMANQYIKEMGDLANEYIKYKSNYNIGSKIKVDNKVFLQDTTFIMSILKKRMEKEDKELYYLIKMRNL